MSYFCNRVARITQASLALGFATLITGCAPVGDDSSEGKDAVDLSSSTQALSQYETSLRARIYWSVENGRNACPELAGRTTSVLLSTKDSETARLHSLAMSKAGKIYSPSNLGSAIGAGWRAIGTNVGQFACKYETDRRTYLDKAFWASKRELSTLQDCSYQTVGIGVVPDSNGWCWVTEIFVKR